MVGDGVNDAPAMVSLGVMVLLMSATIFGMGIATVVMFHEGSTLLVVANALRLLACRSRAR